jgi:hypothetical protein
VLAMRRFSCGSSLLTCALLVVLAIILVGHVCVLPGHGHVEAATEHPDTDQPYDSDESVHAASCEMLRSSWVTGVVIFIPSAFAVPSPTKDLIGQVPHSQVSFAATRPPLFLLHASLLI